MNARLPGSLLRLVHEVEQPLHSRSEPKIIGQKATSTRLGRFMRANAVCLRAFCKRDQQKKTNRRNRRAFLVPELNLGTHPVFESSAPSPVESRCYASAVI